MISLEIVRLLLTAGVDLGSRLAGPRTALHYAAYLAEIPIIRELFPEHNTNLLAVDIFGDTPFDFATNADRRGRPTRLACCLAACRTLVS